MSKKKEEESPARTFQSVIVRVTDFLISPRIIFQCICCDTAITERYAGVCHATSSGHCASCGAYYDIEWHGAIEQVVIEMRQAKVNEKRGKA